MKLERLNENQIRCILSRADLEKRKLGLAELAFGSEKAKDLFQDMMQQAYNELDFDVDNIPLMIEAIPVSLDCLILVITKVEDPEELESRMHEVNNILRIDSEEDMDDLEESFDMLDDFDEMDDLEDADISDDLDEDDLNEMSSAVSPETDNPMAAIFADARAAFEKMLEKKFKEKASADSSDNAGQDISFKAEDDTAPLADQPAKSKQTSKKEKIQLPGVSIYQFECLDDVVTLSGLIAPFFEGESLLYKDEADASFYLTLKQADSSRADYDRACTICCDYGYGIVDNYATPSYFTEHFTPVFEEDALYYLNQLND